MAVLFKVFFDCGTCLFCTPTILYAYVFLHVTSSISISFFFVSPFRFSAHSVHSTRVLLIYNYNTFCYRFFFHVKRRYFICFLLWDIVFRLFFCGRGSSNALVVGELLTVLKTAETSKPRRAATFVVHMRVLCEKKKADVLYVSCLRRSTPHSRNSNFFFRYDRIKCKHTVQ